MKRKLLNVMLIDDNDSMNFLNAMVLENSNCAKSVQVFENAQKALGYIRQCLDQKADFPDLIFLDIHMPGLNGWDFLDEYEQTPEFSGKRPIVIMISTSMNPKDLEKKKNYPIIREFRPKPLTSKVLQELLEAYFDPVDDQWRASAI